MTLYEEDSTWLINVIKPLIFSQILKPLDGSKRYFILVRRVYMSYKLAVLMADRGETLNENGTENTFNFCILFDLITWVWEDCEVCR